MYQGLFNFLLSFFYWFYAHSIFQINRAKIVDANHRKIRFCPFLQASSGYFSWGWSPLCYFFCFLVSCCHYSRCFISIPHSHYLLNKLIFTLDKSDQRWGQCKLCPLAKIFLKRQMNILIVGEDHIWIKTVIPLREASCWLLICLLWPRCLAKKRSFPTTELMFYIKLLYIIVTTWAIKTKIVKTPSSYLIQKALIKNKSKKKRPHDLTIKSK